MQSIFVEHGRDTTKYYLVENSPCIKRALIFAIQLYSKVSIVRPSRSRLLEFEKKDSAGSLIETFGKCPDQIV